jgi:hypothetical protein
MMFYRLFGRLGCRIVGRVMSGRAQLRQGVGQARQQAEGVSC